MNHSTLEIDIRPCDGCNRDYEFIINQDRGYCDNCYIICREPYKEYISPKQANEHQEWKVAIAESAKQRAKLRVKQRAMLKVNRRGV